MTHYAIMNSQEECLERFIPVALVVYHAYLKILHTGMTAESILKLDDARFGQLFAQMHHITCDAGLAPYQPDVVPELTFSPGGLGIGARGTENIVSVLAISCHFSSHFLCFTCFSWLTKCLE